MLFLIDQPFAVEVQYKGSEGYKCEYFDDVNVNSGSRASKSCKKATCETFQWTTASSPSPVEPTVEPTAPAPCSGSVLAGVSRFTWGTMRGCCRGDDDASHSDTAIAWVIDGSVLDAAVANCSAACAMKPDCTAYEVSRKKIRGQFKCENHVEPINSASRSTKSCKKTVCSAKTGCATAVDTALQITAFSVPCLAVGCEQVDTPPNQGSNCGVAIASVASRQSALTTEYTCSMACRTSATCDTRARRAPNQEAALIDIFVIRPATQDATNEISKDEEVAQSITVSFAVTDPETNETTTVTQETEEPELKEILPDNQDATNMSTFMEDLADQFEDAPACGNDQCCNDALCVATFGSESKCCSNKAFCRNDDSCKTPLTTTEEPSTAPKYRFN